MAKGTPKGGGKAVGYGKKGNAFTSQKAYNQSKEGQRHAKNPNLSTTPIKGPAGGVLKGKKGNVFFNQKKANVAIAARRAAKNPVATKTGTPGIGHPPPQHHTAVTPMPGHPSQNPTHYHGPATTGLIGTGSKPVPGPGAPRKGGGSGSIPKPPVRGLPGRTAGGGMGGFGLK